MQVYLQLYKEHKAMQDKSVLLHIHREHKCWVKQKRFTSASQRAWRPRKTMQMADEWRWSVYSLRMADIGDNMSSPCSCGLHTTSPIHHHHHRQPWAQCPLVSDAIFTIAAHRCLSRAAWLNSCRVVPHHCSMSSDHSWWGRPLLFEHPSFRTPGSLSFCCRSFCRYGRRGATFSVSLSAVGFLSIESFCTILH